MTQNDFPAVNSEKNIFMKHQGPGIIEVGVNVTASRKKIIF
jgi:hypothetical protein